MDSLLKDIATSAHYSWGQNCDSWWLLDTETLAVKQEEMPPGSSEILHMHLVAQQFFYILRGTAVFTINNKKLIATAGQGIHVPAGTRHQVANEANEPLHFLVISQPTTNNDRENLL